MRELLPDFGDLILYIALLFGALIVIFETIERRHETRSKNLLLNDIQREYSHYTRRGYF